MVEAKQNSLKRQRTAEKARMYNKSRKSEISTRMKKVRAALPPPGLLGLALRQCPVPPPAHAGWRDSCGECTA